jgi:hypothetical protein
MLRRKIKQKNEEEWNDDTQNDKTMDGSAYINIRRAGWAPIRT